MQIPVLVEPVSGNGYRARGVEPFGFVAEGTTRAEALANWKQQFQARVRAGAELVTLEVGPQSHPWLEFAGMFKDDPDFKDVLEIMAANRHRLDADPDTP